MRPMILAAAAIAWVGLTACAAPPSASDALGASGAKASAFPAPARDQSPAQTQFSGPALDFTPEPGKDFGDQTAFTRSVAQRYGAPAPLAAVTEDLKAFGMACSPLTGVAPSPDMALMDCVRADNAQGSCFDTYAVTLFKAPGDSIVRVGEARYARRCLGALPARGSWRTNAVMTLSSSSWRALDPARARPAPAAGVGAAFARFVCSAWLKLGGWRMRGDWPEGVKKCVLLAAPHTSNWDGVNMLAAAGFYRVKLRWMGKKSLASGPLGVITRWAGIVPIDRSASNNVVAAMKQAFAEAEHLVLAVAPEGTRTLNRDWKRGYYHIAVGAGVPIVFSVLDYRRRTISLAGVLTPSGDYDADWPIIRSVYADAGAKFPKRYGVPD